MKKIITIAGLFLLSCFLSLAAAVPATFSSRAVVTASTTNTLQTVPVAYNQLVRIRTIGVAAVGGTVPFAVTATSTNGYLFVTASNNTASGTPVNVGFVSSTGTNNAYPVGLTNNVVYYVGLSNYTDVRVYTNMSQATNGGATGQVPWTAVGTNVTLVPSTLNAAYILDIVAKNVNGVVSLVGTTTTVANEDVAAWNLTATANTARQGVDIAGVADITLPTTFNVKSTTDPYGYKE